MSYQHWWNKVLSIVRSHNEPVILIDPASESIVVVMSYELYEKTKNIIPTREESDGVDSQERQPIAPSFVESASSSHVQDSLKNESVEEQWYIEPVEQPHE